MEELTNKLNLTGVSESIPLPGWNLFLLIFIFINIPINKFCKITNTKVMCLYFRRPTQLRRPRHLPSLPKG